MSAGDVISRLRVGGVTVGIIGLNEALSQAAAAGLQPGDDAAQAILAEIRKANYVAPGGAAALREIWRSPKSASSS